MSLVLGIDFGTSTTKAAVVRDNKIEIIRDVNGNSVLPSCVSFTKRKLFGDDALTQMSVDPCNSVYEAKRLIGCYFDDPFVASDRRFWACRVGRSFDQGQPRFNVDYRSKRRFFAIEIAAILMREMKQNAERMFSTKIDEVVMAVPACFNTLQRKAMEDVVHIAGLSIKRTLNEPTAIALAYYNRKRMPSKAELVLVLDIGGGFFDVSVLTVGSQNLRVRGTAGGRWGGIDIDNTLTSHFASEIKTIHRIDLFDKTHAKTLFLLRRKCEQAKIKLSGPEVESVKIELNSASEDFEYCGELTRAKLEELCADWFENIENGIQSVVKSLKIKTEQIDRVLLSGGSTLMPRIQLLLRRLVGQRDVEVWHNTKAVVNGCAIMGKKGSFWQKHHVDIWPFGYEVVCQDGKRAPALLQPFYQTPFSITTRVPANVNLRLLELREVSVNGNEARITMSLGRLQLLDSEYVRLVLTVDIDGILAIEAETDADKMNIHSVMYDELHSAIAVRKMIEEAKRDAKWEMAAEDREALQLANETTTTESSEEQEVSSTSSEDEYFDQNLRETNNREEKRDPDYVPQSVSDDTAYLPSYARRSRKRKVGTNPNSMSEEECTK